LAPPGANFKLYLYPDLKHQERNIRDNHREKLLRLTDDVEASYRGFRRLVKENLTI